MSKPYHLRITFPDRSELLLETYHDNLEHEVVTTVATRKHSSETWGPPEAVEVEEW